MRITCLGQCSNEILKTEESLLTLYLTKCAAWHGTRSVLRETSPEAIDIFDFIIELAGQCSGNWATLADECEVDPGDLNAFLDCAATFLSNIGNYYECFPNSSQLSSVMLTELGLRRSKVHTRCE